MKKRNTKTDQYNSELKLDKMNAIQSQTNSKLIKSVREKENKKAIKRKCCGG